MKSGNQRSRLFFFRIIHSLTPNTSSVKYSWISRKTWGKRFLHNDVFSPQVLAGTIASTCEDGCKYLRERLQVLALEDTVHCKDGCSALRERLQCTASEMGKTGTEIVSPILDQRKGIVAVRIENDVSASGYLVRTFLPLMTETPL